MSAGSLGRWNGAVRRCGRWRQPTCRARALLQPAGEVRVGFGETEAGFRGGPGTPKGRTENRRRRWPRPPRLGRNSV